jgi:sulfur carrier protein ThiS
MGVKIIPIGLLKRYFPNQDSMTLEDAEGKTIAEALKGLNIPPELVSIVLVNGRQESKGYVLKKGDRVKLVPLVGGGSQRLGLCSREAGNHPFG